MLWNWIEEQLPDEPHWFLDAIGVEPERQGEGIGAALVRWGIARAAADGVPAFLETGLIENVGYYERFGFRVVHEGEPEPGGVARLVHAPRPVISRWTQPPAANRAISSVCSA